jgi:hypothetical protein
MFILIIIRSQRATHEWKTKIIEISSLAVSGVSSARKKRVETFHQNATSIKARENNYATEANGEPEK